ncbi:DoxX family protein [Salinimicrobium sp. CDJ15-81-2]|nr:DoxX family protein [Salinimicrobium nanhaiense]
MENFVLNLPVYLILIFTAITFLQSGIDKLVDWKGNYGWLTGHFKGTFMGGMVSLLLGTILVLEVITGLLALAAIFTLWMSENLILSQWALGLAAVTLLMLLFGQRVAKDYAGAFTIVGYFIVIIFGLFLVTA